MAFRQFAAGMILVVTTSMLTASELPIWAMILIWLPVWVAYGAILGYSWRG